MAPDRLADRIVPLGPAGVTLSGYLGTRVAANDAHLALVDLEPLLAGFRQRPGTHPWIGEHIGKWLHAASLTYARTGDGALGARLDDAVSALLATQEADGYLGTYPSDRRFGLHPGADWDVWVHKYVLIGLLAFVDATGDDRALHAACRIGDLLDRTFRTGDRPTRIIDAGTHVGMAATSVLEPVVALHRHTGEGCYLELAWSIVEAWDLDGGPRVLSTLRDSGRVRDVGNGKAYEMLSNFVGLCELARASGDLALVDAVVRGWDDIVANHRYVTGGASFTEHFGRDGELPAPMAVNVAETCVTVTWLQLTHQLLRLTGEARVAEELERTAYNQLLAAQHPDGRTWCYYTPLDGYKPYGPGISCCVSSGPRGIALLPTMVLGRTAADATAVVLFESADADRISVRSSLPATGGTTIRSDTDLLIRAPAWADQASIDGGPLRPDDRGWHHVPAVAGRRVDVELAFGPRRIDGGGTDRGRIAHTIGPFVLAYDTRVPGHDRRTPAFDVLAGTEVVTSGPASVDLVRRLSNEVDDIVDVPVRLVPFAEVGVDGGPFRVWARATNPPLAASLLGGGTETRSAGTIGHGSAIDYEPYSFLSTYDGQDHDEDWFAVTVDDPVTVGRIVIGHGWSWVNGGWFDSSAMRPVVDVQAAPDAPWETIGELPGYPATTAEDPAGLRGGETFVLRLTPPRRISGVRVRGRGSVGQYPPARYATCGEISASAE